jgi:outer membrane protein assembly factor BamB
VFDRQAPDVRFLGAATRLGLVRRWGVLAIALVAVGLTGCDSPFVRVGANRSGWNLGEPTRSAAEIAAYDELWDVELGRALGNPVVAGGTVFVSTAGVQDQSEPSLVALDAGSGEERWSYDVPTTPLPPPTAVLTDPGVAGGEVYVGVEQTGPAQNFGTVLAFDAATGGSGREVSDEPGRSSPIRVGDVVYSTWVLYLGSTGTRNAGIQGVDADTGDVVFGALGSGGAVAVEGDRLYAVVHDQLRAYSLTDTTRCVETFTLPARDNPTLDCAPLWSAAASGFNTPAVHGGYVYLGGGDGVLRAFAADGCGAATCSPVWTGATGGAIRTDAAVDGRTVVVGSDDGKVHAFPATGCGAATCAATWTATPGGGAVLSSPTLASGFVFVGAESGHVRAFTATGCGAPTCTAVWSEATGAAVRTDPAVANGTVVVTDVGGTVHLYGAPPATT